MADETSQEEPSMEEILASIRRIISEDGEEEGEGAAEAGADADGDAAADAVAAEDGATAADGGAAEEVAAEAVVAEAPAEEAGAEEVLELTEEVDAQGNVVAEGADEASAFEADTPAPAAIACSTPDPVVDMSDSVAEPLTPVGPASTLMENVAEGAAAGAFAALASQIGPGRADNNAQQVTPGGRTIEDHVLEMLRPMLREWLDKHLPQMVQRLVQREIDRIIHRSDPV